MQSVLADTGPLFAALDRSDALHARAQGELSLLSREQWQVVVLYSTVLECYTLILRTLSIRDAHRWLGETISGTRVVNPTPGDYQHAMGLVRTYDDQPLTLFDALTATVAERLKLPVWTYDHHFDILRTRVWPRWSES